MHILVNGVQLFVDVANAGLVPDGDRMREKPALLMLHGGPGFDHVPLKSAFSALSDVAQVVFYDHRGNGRSEGDDPSTWNLAQWGDDVKGLCDALGIVKPIVCGLSFGGFVAQSYATRYPDHPGKLILLSTAAKIDFPTVFETFTRIGGREIGALAESYLTNPTVEGRAAYIRLCVPFYRHRRDRPVEPVRAIIRAEVALHFNGPRNEHGRFDFRDDLAKVACPVLMIGGEHDPIVPISLAEATAGSLPSHLVRLRVEPPGSGMRTGKVWNGRILVVAARSGEGPFYPLVRDVLAALILRAWRGESIPVRSKAVQRKLAERSANPTAPDLLGHQSMPPRIVPGERPNRIHCPH